MELSDLTDLVASVRDGSLEPAAAVEQLRRLPYADLGFARIDHHRELRAGLPEAVYGPGKTPEQCAGIVAELLSVGSGPVLLTRATPKQVTAALEVAPGGRVVATTPQPDGIATVVWRAMARRVLRAPERAGGRGSSNNAASGVVLVTAGTADLGVAAECAVVLEALGHAVSLRADCGVAGLHRVLSIAGELADAAAVVVVAGMEGALASVVAGLTPAPVVAVPTSAGYGASLEGVTALLAMLAACSAGITVVGIDNGFGAACAVGRLLR